MIDHQDAMLTLRTRLATLSVVTTGSATLGVSSGAFSRSTGSFLTDGFKAGMEVTSTGFSVAANNTTTTVTAVTATTMSVEATLSTETAASGKTIAVGQPDGFASENVPYEPTRGVPFLEEQFLGGPTRQITLGEFGWIEHDPTYVLQVHVPEGVGIGALNAYADALITLFAPRTGMTMTNGDALRVRTNPGPFRGQVRNLRTGYATVAVTIPLRVHTANTI